MEVAVEGIQVLRDVCVKKRECSFIVIQQQANSLGRNCDPDVWGHPIVEKFIGMSVQEKSGYS